MFNLIMQFSIVIVERLGIKREGKTSKIAGGGEDMDVDPCFCATLTARPAPRKPVDGTLCHKATHGLRTIWVEKLGVVDKASNGLITNR